MKKLLLLLSSAFLLLANQNIKAQEVRSCASHDHHTHLLQSNPDYISQRQAIEQHTENFVSNTNKKRIQVTIPVVVHVVYNTTSQNISDAQVQSQIAVLNNDFRKLNADASLIPAAFQGLAADCEINFCLAAQDPNGNPTNGIVRKFTSVTSFSQNDAIKFDAQGGSNIWDRSKYLNIWVGNLSNGLLGYAQFPGGPAATDGVVCRFNAFGTVGTLSVTFNKGRTATHEVGHWLNLFHIWGDDGGSCLGSDYVNDTPNQADENYGCPTFPTVSCNNGPDGDMFMNYMDYSNDACMYMFTQGQKDRMQALFASNGFRVSLLTSNGCTPPSTVSCGTPGNLSSSNITTSDATITWAAVSGATSYNVEYKLSSASTWTTLTASTNSSTLSGLMANTSYDVQVQAVCNGTPGAFSTPISFTTANVSTPSCIDNYEPNNSRSQSASIPTDVDVFSMIGSAGDNDYFVITTTNAAPKLRIDLTNLPFDYDLKLYRSNGRQIGGSQKAGTTSEVIRYNTATEGSTYFIYVYGYNGANSNSQCYTLKASTSASNWRMDENELIADKPEIDVYPNPANTKVSIKYFAKSGDVVQASILNTMGQKVLSQVVDAEEGENNINFNVENLPKGIYLMELFDGEDRKVQKFMVSE